MAVQLAMKHEEIDLIDMPIEVKTLDTSEHVPLQCEAFVFSPEVGSSDDMVQKRRIRCRHHRLEKTRLDNFHEESNDRGGLDGSVGEVNLG